MDGEKQISEKRVQRYKYQRTRNIPRSWFCRLFGHMPDCQHCDPHRETQPLLGKN